MRIALIAFLLHMHSTVAHSAEQFCLTLGVTVNVLEDSNISFFPH